MRLTLASLLLVAVATGAYAQPAAEAPRLQVGLAAAADLSAVYPSTVFLSPVTELTASFRLADGEAFERLSASWIAVDVGAAAPPNFEIVASELKLNGMTSGRFRYEQPQPMPEGRYRIEVAADGEPWQSTEFEIAPARGAQSSSEVDLVPLAAGQQWTYRFEQRPGQGARIEIPGVTPDPDGAFSATVEISVGDSDADEAHLITFRNGEPVFEEWWRLDDAGLWALRRKQGANETVLDPPQLLWAMPGTAEQWTYPPFEQSFRMWGPMPMSGPWGKGEGYVVLLRQPADAPLATVERHFVPGIGMVREIIVQAIAGKLMSRQEMELMKR